jgi:hypothetical protein
MTDTPPRRHAVHTMFLAIAAGPIIVTPFVTLAFWAFSAWRLQDLPRIGGAFALAGVIAALVIGGPIALINLRTYGLPWHRWASEGALAGLIAAALAGIWLLLISPLGAAIGSPFLVTLRIAALVVTTATLSALASRAILGLVERRMGADA